MTITIKQLDGTAITEFLSQWPCHNFPDNIDGITCAFDKNGDLLDLDCYDEEDELIDHNSFDGEALVALVKECRDKGIESSLL